MAAQLKRPPRIAFLFLGETLLIPHLWPLVEALAAEAPDVAIECWVSTSVHEALLTRWSNALPSVCIRRASLFRTLGQGDDGRNPPQRGKLRMLGLTALRLFGARAIVCAEQTSLWVPMVAPWYPAPFVKTSHGVGSMSARDDPRRRAARLMLVPSEQERETYLRRGFHPDRVRATGYVKAEFRQRTPAVRLFAAPRPVVLYTPHWQRARSSWWAWGREIVAALAAQRRFNVILAPHQRLAETDPGVREVLAGVAALDHVHVDLDSFATVDGSYTAAADIYLGDTSSQVVEFLARPRPCVFLDAQGTDWQARADHAFWHCGDVVERPEDVVGALENAQRRHAHYAARQTVFRSETLGDADGAAALRCARHILAAARLPRLH